MFKKSSPHKLSEFLTEKIGKNIDHCHFTFILT